MRRFVIATGIGIMFLAALATACAGPTPTPRPSPTITPIPAPTATPTPTLAPTPIAFFLEVLAPKNESVVSASPTEVRGRTIPDAIVSVNGQSVEVDANGNFSTQLTLQEGPNSIEVVASDFQGHQDSRVISVIYVR